MVAYFIQISLFRREVLAGGFSIAGGRGKLANPTTRWFSNLLR